MLSDSQICDKSYGVHPIKSLISACVSAVDDSGQHRVQDNKQTSVRTENPHLHQENILPKEKTMCLFKKNFWIT